MVTDFFQCFSHAVGLMSLTSVLSNYLLMYLMTFMYSGVGCIAVNVEYRLAPDYPFPASIDDGCTVARWVLGHKTIVGKHELFESSARLYCCLLIVQSRGFKSKILIDRREDSALVENVGN